MKHIDLFPLRMLLFVIGHFLHSAPRIAVHKRLLERWRKLRKTGAD